MAIDPNASAHPHGHLNSCPSCGSGGKAGTTGLTIRAHFAAMAMQGAVTLSKEGRPFSDIEIAEFAVHCADALIEALNK